MSSNETEVGPIISQATTYSKRLGHFLGYFSYAGTGTNTGTVRSLTCGTEGGTLYITSGSYAGCYDSYDGKVGLPTTCANYITATDTAPPANTKLCSASGINCVTQTIFEAMPFVSPKSNFFCASSDYFAFTIYRALPSTSGLTRVSTISTNSVTSPPSSTFISESTTAPARSSPQLSSGATAGVSVAGVLLLLAIAFAVWYPLQKRRKKKNLDGETYSGKPELDSTELDAVRAYQGRELDGGLILEAPHNQINAMNEVPAELHSNHVIGELGHLNRNDEERNSPNR